MGSNYVVSFEPEKYTKCFRDSEQMRISLGISKKAFLRALKKRKVNVACKENLERKLVEYNHRLTTRLTSRILKKEYIEELILEGKLINQLCKILDTYPSKLNPQLEKNYNTSNLISIRELLIKKRKKRKVFNYE